MTTTSISSSCLALGAASSRQQRLLSLEFLSDAGEHPSAEDSLAVVAPGIQGARTSQVITFAGETPRAFGEGRFVHGRWTCDEHFDCAALRVDANPGASDEQQIHACFAEATAALESLGMAATDIIRTWIYLDDIDRRYEPLNRVRNAFFASQGFTRMPASTGIGAANPRGAAVAFGLIALRPRHARASIASVASPLQCPAPDYRSAFSRALRIACPDYRRLLISGTASIAPGGASLHQGDARAQIERTFAALDALLAAEGLGWHDVDRVIGYAKTSELLQPLHQALARHGQSGPSVLADICRSELLVEIEVDACRR